MSLGAAVDTSLDPVLERLLRETSPRVMAGLRAGAGALLPMAAEPWLARLPLELLDRLAEPRPKPLSTRFGRQRYRAGFIARRSAEDWVGRHRIFSNCGAGRKSRPRPAALQWAENLGAPYPPETL